MMKPFALSRPEAVSKGRAHLLRLYELNVMTTSVRFAIVKTEFQRRLMPAFAGVMPELK